MKSNEKYTNSKKQFSSYFLSFPDTACKIELMHNPDIAKTLIKQNETIGLTHFAISLGSKQSVDKLTQKLQSDGYTIASEARTTGDGYYESLIIDPEGNRVELTV